MTFRLFLSPFLGPFCLLLSLVFTPFQARASGSMCAFLFAETSLSKQDFPLYLEIEKLRALNQQIEQEGDFGKSFDHEKEIVVLVERLVSLQGEPHSFIGPLATNLSDPIFNDLSISRLYFEQKIIQEVKEKLKKVDPKNRFSYEPYRASLRRLYGAIEDYRTGSLSSLSHEVRIESVSKLIMPIEEATQIFRMSTRGYNLLVQDILNKTQEPIVVIIRDFLKNKIPVLQNQIAQERMNAPKVPMNKALVNIDGIRQSTNTSGARKGALIQSELNKAMKPVILTKEDMDQLLADFIDPEYIHLKAEILFEEMVEIRTAILAQAGVQKGNFVSRVDGVIDASARFRNISQGDKILSNIYTRIDHYRNMDKDHYEIMMGARMYMLLTADSRIRNHPNSRAILERIVERLLDENWWRTQTTQSVVEKTLKEFPR